MAEQEQEQKEMGLDLDARKVKRPWIKIEGVKYHIRRQVDMAEGNFSRFNSLERRLREIDHPDKTVVTEQQLRIRREQAKELFFDVPPHEILRDVTAEQWDEIADFFLLHWQEEDRIKQQSLAEVKAALDNGKSRGSTVTPSSS